MTDVMHAEYVQLLEGLKQPVAASRYKAARAVNRELILLYHHIGSEILKRQEIQGWGSKVIDTLSKDLTAEFPDMKGFGIRNLKYMRLFAEAYPDIEFVQTLLAQLSWYHNLTLLDKVSDIKEREFYIHKAITNNWSRSVLVNQIELNLYHRQGKAINNFQANLPVLWRFLCFSQQCVMMSLRFLLNGVIRAKAGT
jgi:predicted nuclease of restriction endonuclease-like (RecB) superfamily